MSIYERFCVSPCQLVNPVTLTKIIENNRILTLCNYGGGRSPEAARKLNELGHPSVFLGCGLLGLKDLSSDYLERTLAGIRKFSGIYTLLYEREVNGYRELLGNIGVNTFYRDEIEFINLVLRGKILLPQ